MFHMSDIHFIILQELQIVSKADHWNKAFVWIYGRVFKLSLFVFLLYYEHKLKSNRAYCIILLKKLAFYKFHYLTVPILPILFTFFLYNSII